MDEDKRKRGRPPVTSPEHWHGLEKLYEGMITTRRGILNKYYEIKGYSAIKDMLDEGATGLDYLVGSAKGYVRAGILRELGRFDADAIRAYAPAICKAQDDPETKKTVKEWGSVLRLIRLQPDLVNAAISETVSENNTP